MSCREMFLVLSHFYTRTCTAVNLHTTSPFYSHFAPRFIMLWRIVMACVKNELQIGSKQLLRLTTNTISPVKVVVHISYRKLTPEQFQLIYNITHRRPQFGP